MRRSASDERPWRRRSESGAEEAGMTKQVAETAWSHPGAVSIGRPSFSSAMTVPELMSSG